MCFKDWCGGKGGVKGWNTPGLKTHFHIRQDLRRTRSFPQYRWAEMAMTSALILWFLRRMLYIRIWNEHFFIGLLFMARQLRTCFRLRVHALVLLKLLQGLKIISNMSLYSSQILFKWFRLNSVKMYFYEASSICFLLLAFFSSRWTHISIWAQKYCMFWEIQKNKYKRINYVINKI